MTQLFEFLKFTQEQKREFNRIDDYYSEIEDEDNKNKLTPHITNLLYTTKLLPSLFAFLFKISKNPNRIPFISIGCADCFFESLILKHFDNFEFIGIEPNPSLSNSFVKMEPCLEIKYPLLEDMPIPEKNSHQLNCLLFLNWCFPEDGFDRQVVKSRLHYDIEAILTLLPRYLVIIYSSNNGNTNFSGFNTFLGHLNESGLYEEISYGKAGKSILTKMCSYVIFKLKDEILISRMSLSNKKKLIFDSLKESYRKARDSFLYYKEIDYIESLRQLLDKSDDELVFIEASKQAKKQAQRLRDAQKQKRIEVQKQKRREAKNRAKKKYKQDLKSKRQGQDSYQDLGFFGLFNPEQQQS